MRRTVMGTFRGDWITIQTGDAGTEVLDGQGMVLAAHGTDHHDEVIALREQAGWRVAEDQAIRPPEAAGTPPPTMDGGGEGAPEPDLGDAG